MGSNYEIIAFDHKKGGDQASIYADTYAEALKIIEKLSKTHHCVTMIIRTGKKGLV